MLTDWLGALTSPRLFGGLALGLFFLAVAFFPELKRSLWRRR